MREKIRERRREGDRERERRKIKKKKPKKIFVILTSIWDHAELFIFSVMRILWIFGGRLIFGKIYSKIYGKKWSKVCYFLQISFGWDGTR